VRYGIYLDDADQLVISGLDVVVTAEGGGIQVTDDAFVIKDCTLEFGPHEFNIERQLRAFSARIPAPVREPYMIRRVP